MSDRPSQRIKKAEHSSQILRPFDISRVLCYDFIPAIFNLIASSSGTLRIVSSECLPPVHDI